MTANSTISRRASLKLFGSAALSATMPFLGPPLLGNAPALAKAPMLGVPRTDFRRFKLGDFEITMIRDGAANLAGPYPSFGADQFEEDVHELLARHNLPLRRFELPYAPVLVNTGSQLVLIDAGNGAARRPDSGHLLEGMKLAGYTPEQVDVVIITHCHPDHIGGLMDNGVPAFPNARYVCGETEYDFWSPKSLLEADPGVARRARVVQDNIVPLAERMTFVKDDGEAVPGIRAIASPGHTPGHLAYHIESNSQRLLVWGDAIVHHVISFERPQWPLAADMNKELAAESRAKLLDMAAADRIAVSGYHLPFPAFGYVEKLDDGYRFVPASYQFDL